ncbi:MULTISPECIES: DUF378 domain-containing protein [unclassified Clostridium]|uniref:DUF378 domain-containing protein n=1 Tax=Clostridium botulinum (strain Eklund 17B / Type B) TaxID=935198 RepID=B2TJ73_CLOBB|nr:MULTISPECIES: DUF378 domain-containing protein [unclassified Clostridium]ACD25142.1 hypothetical protein CLL_A1291 [Clostridium botulinum B str. Eklund 17B (NRP)]MBN1044957.1 DUF378 domain-containing protein [Clostridium botulinum]MBN1051681.1 DUF378 domain-containing protein [Clostridium botulinum]MBY6974887.1 DUF378 domain-containing protein [Clostridium botulinum]MBY6999867.1 DUF378 domain-containing protein [Clostridium botulinum]
MYKLNIFDKISFILVILGALNWGLIGLLNINLVTIFSFGIPIVQRIIYIIIFLSALNLIALLFKCNNNLNKKFN